MPLWTYWRRHSGRSGTSSLGCIRGTGTGTKDENGRPADLLDLSNDMGRLLVLLDRAGDFPAWKLNTDTHGSRQENSGEDLFVRFFE